MIFSGISRYLNFFSSALVFPGCHESLGVLGTPEIFEFHIFFPDTMILDFNLVFYVLLLWILTSFYIIPQPEEPATRWGSYLFSKKYL